MGNVTEQSLIDSAERIVRKKKTPLDLYELFNFVCAEKGYSEDDKSSLVTQFYTDLITSAKFVYTGDNTWDLKEFQKTDLREKDGFFYKEYTVIPDTEEDIKAEEEKVKAKKAKKAKAKAKVKAKVKAKAKAKVKPTVEEVIVEEAAVKEAAIKEAAIKEAVVEEAKAKTEVKAKAKKATKSAAEKVESKADEAVTEYEEEVFEEVENEFDEDKYNEYMDTYEDKYDEK